MSEVSSESNFKLLEIGRENEEVNNINLLNVWVAENTGKAYK